MIVSPFVFERHRIGVGEALGPRRVAVRQNDGGRCNKRCRGPPHMQEGQQVAGLRAERVPADSMPSSVTGSQSSIRTRGRLSATLVISGSALFVGQKQRSARARRAGRLASIWVQ